MKIGHATCKYLECMLLTANLLLPFLMSTDVALETWPVFNDKFKHLCIGNAMSRLKPLTYDKMKTCYFCAAGKVARCNIYNPVLSSSHEVPDFLHRGLWPVDITSKK